MKIKKCPFCGKKIEDKFPHIYEMEDGEWVMYHHCNKGLPLTVICTVYGTSKEEVIERWNGRAEDE